MLVNYLPLYQWLSLPDFYVKWNKFIISSVTVAGKNAKVLYTFLALVKDQLTFKEGDIVSVLDEFHDYWWKGQLGNKRGIFPSTYVKVIGEKHATRASFKTGPSLPYCISTIVIYLYIYYFLSKICVWIWLNFSNLTRCTQKGINLIYHL